MKLLTALVIATLAATNAFVPLSSFGTTRRSSAQSLDDKSDSEKALAHNKARTDVRNFLTQRSIQSFIYLLIETRDPHTVTWMERFGGWTNLENFHGTGALNMTLYPTWDSVLRGMISQPLGEVIVSAKRRGRGHGGWSKNNPYLEERFVEFTIDIDPVSLVSRIISVREQLAAEWTEDLNTFVSANEKILQSYHDRAMDARDTEDEKSSSLTVPYSEKQTAYDRHAMALDDFGVFSANAPSPLRKGNFDLTVLLVTQESVHRVLRQYREDDQKVAFEWLREFYTERVPKFFDGHGGFARADDFLEELLLTPPSVKKNVGGKADLIDPLRIAEDIIRMRTSVGLDFKDAVTNVPRDHVEIRKIILTKQMQRWGNPTPEPVGEATETEIIKGGEFE